MKLSLVASAGVDIAATSAWDLSLGSPLDTIAVLDTGVDSTHPEFNGKLELGPSFGVGLATSDDSSRVFSGTCADSTILACRHGTAVAGIAAANTNNTAGIAGVAPSTSVLAIRVMDQDGYGNDTEFAAALEHTSSRQVPIINASVAYPPPGAPGDDPGASLLGAAVRNSYYRGSLLVAAMGNSGNNSRWYPAGYSSTVLAVGGTFPNGLRYDDNAVWPSFMFNAGSCHGNWIDVSAPGGEFIVAPRYGTPSHLHPAYYNLNTCNPLTYQGFGGTSAATPVVSGVAALIRGLRPTVTGDDIAEILRRSATDLAPSGIDDSTGHGMVNAYSALSYIDPSIKALEQSGVGFLATAGVLTVVDSASAVRAFKGVPNLPDTSFSVTVVTLGGWASFSSGFTTSPDVWLRGSGSIGWLDSATVNYYDDVMSGLLAAGTVTAAGCSLYTWTYRFPDGTWFPAPPDSARLAYSALAQSSVIGVEEVDTTPGLRLTLKVIRQRASGRGVKLLLAGGSGSQGAVDLYDVRGRRLGHWSVFLADGLGTLVLTEQELRRSGAVGGMYLARATVASHSVTQKIVITASR